MRMWLVDPEIMCRKHLLGEHLEVHMFVGTMLKGKSIDGYVTKGLFEMASLQMRHDDLVKEMESRGYKHSSILKQIPYDLGYWIYQDVFIDREKSLKDLLSRCPECLTNYYRKKGLEK